MQTVLVIEDSSELAKLWQQTLPGFGLHVRLAGSLREAFVALAAEVPDCIVLDLCLPNGAGVNCVKAVRAVAADTPLIVVTGSIEPGLRERCLAAGADVYLEKPTGVKDMVREIKVAIATRSTLAECGRHIESARRGLACTRGM